MPTKLKEVFAKSIPSVVRFMEVAPLVVVTSPIIYASTGLRVKRESPYHSLGESIFIERKEGIKMFDPTGGHTSPVAILIILAMCGASILLIAISVFGIKNGYKYKKNIFLLCLFLTWLLIATGVGLYSGIGIFGLFLGVLLYSPVHVLFWLLISGISFLLELRLKSNGLT